MGKSIIDSTLLRTVITQGNTEIFFGVTLNPQPGQIDTLCVMDDGISRLRLAVIFLYLADKMSDGIFTDDLKDVSEKLNRLADIDEELDETDSPF